MKALAFLAAAALAAAATPGSAQSSPLCKLHVFPSATYNVIDKDNNWSLQGNAVVTSSTLTRLDQPSKVLAEAVPVASQLAAINKAIRPLLGERFELVFHDQPPQTTFARAWTDKKLIAGPRVAGAGETCHAELHVLLVTLMDQPLKDILQSMFLLRLYGPGTAPEALALEGGYGAAPAFDYVAGRQAEPTRARYKEIFAENFGKFLTRRKTRKALAVMLEADNR